MIHACYFILFHLMMLKINSFRIQSWKSVSKTINKSLLSSTAASAIKYEGLNHIGVLVKDANLSKQFYIEMFNCIDVTADQRPITLPFQGAFLQFGRSQIHLMELPNPDPTNGRPEHGGRGNMHNDTCHTSIVTLIIQLYCNNQSSL